MAEAGPRGVHVVEVREPRLAPRRIAVDHPVVVGRENADVIVDDPTVSRRHLVLEPGFAHLSVTDLGSRNGTRVNDVAVTGSVEVAVGDRVSLGSVEIAVVAGPAVEAPRAGLAELAARAVDGAVIRFRPGTAGERAAADMAASVRRARRRLAGLGPELDVIAPQICLLDPFPDPSVPDRLVTSGSVVDVERREIWMVVTPELPPEPLERPLALLLGATLPAAADIGLLLEGFGLAVAGSPSPDAQLRDLDLPALDEADGELRSAMAQSFVTFLLGREGRDAFVGMLTRAAPGGLDIAVRDIFGQSLSALEETWAASVGAPPPKVKTTQFLRLTVPYLRPYVLRELEIFVYMLLALAFTVVFPFAMRRLVDTAIPHGNFGQVVAIISVLGAAFVVSLGGGLRRTYLSALVSSAVTRDLRVDMFTRLQTLSSRWFEHQQEGDILSRLFSDVGQVEQGLSQTIREGIFQMLTLVVSAVVLLTLDPLLAVIVLAGAPLVGVVYRLMAAGAQKRSLAVQQELATTYTVASENYVAQPVVKAFGLEGREQARFVNASQRLFGREVRLQLFGGLFGLSVNMIVSVLQLFVLGLGSWLVIHGRLTIGGLVAFTTTMGQVLSPVAALTGLGQQIQAATGSLLRIEEVTDSVPDIDDAPAATALPRLSREIRLDDVCFSYVPARRTLDGLSCVVPAGSRVAFVGPTGAGKSSVLQLIARFYDPDDGTIRFDGRDIGSGTRASLRRQIGIVFQDTFLFDATIRENIAVGNADASDAEIEAAACAAELDEFVQGLPRGYETLVGERGGRLSGGQRQRLALARALVRDPRVLLLDEATSSLDPRTERLINATLERVGEERTIIAVTHRLTSITDYDQIFVMTDGRIVERGSHRDLLARAGIYAELWAEQTGGGARIEPQFAAHAALGAVPLFFDLAPDALADVATRLRPFDLPAGARLPEDAGNLAIVSRGRPVVLGPALDGELVPIAQLRPGEAFGVSALLGARTGSVLMTDEPVGLLVLGPPELGDVAAEYPSVAAALAGEGPERLGPSGGERLSRASVVPRSSAAERASSVGLRVLGADEVRRTGGAHWAAKA